MQQTQNKFLQKYIENTAEVEADYFSMSNHAFMKKYEIGTKLLFKYFDSKKKDKLEGELLKNKQVIEGIMFRLNISLEEYKKLNEKHTMTELKNAQRINGKLCIPQLVHAEYVEEPLY